MNLIAEVDTATCGHLVTTTFSLFMVHYVNLHVAIYWLPNYVCGIVEGWTSGAGIVDPEGWILG